MPDLEREYNALMKQLEAGHCTDPNEIGALMKQLYETNDSRCMSWAERLGRWLRV